MPWDALTQMRRDSKHLRMCHDVNCPWDAGLCPFAHDVTLLHGRLEKWRVKPCRNFNGEHGVCNQGRQCTYGHGKNQGRLPLEELACGPSLYRVIEGVAERNNVKPAQLAEFIATTPALRAPLR